MPDQRSSKQVSTGADDLKTSLDNQISAVIIGSIALDIGTRFSNPNVNMNDSNPGQIKSSIGGVGYNISLACKYGLDSPSCGSLGIKASRHRLVSVVADDFAGRSLVKQLEENGMDTSGIQISKTEYPPTAQYISMHDQNGELVLACADMSLVEQESFAKHIIDQLSRAQPKFVVLDCNVSAKVMNEVLEFIGQNLPEAEIIIEPTSSPKAARISQIDTKNLKVFPQNLILLISPTVAELDSIYFSLSSRELFDDYDNWFPLLDSLGIDSQFREKLNALSRKYSILEDGLKEGYLQKAFQVLPYLPNILLKLGSQGLLYVTLSTCVSDYHSIPTTSQYSPEFTITTQGKEYIDNDGNSKRMGVVIQYFPIPEENNSLQIESVSGAGDTLLGYLLAKLLVSYKELQKETWIASEIENIEQEWTKWESIYKAQLASGLSLQSNKTVNNKIADLI